MREWQMTYNYNDLEEPTGTCELCEHPEIRHQFEVRNSYTDINLWIGSKCIEKFVPLYQNNVEITDRFEKARLLAQITTRFINDAKRERAERLLEELSKHDDRFADTRWNTDWRKGYSVKQLQMIAVAAKGIGRKFDAADFHINTRRQNIVEQAKKLAPWQYEQLRAAFPRARQKELDQFFRAF